MSNDAVCTLSLYGKKSNKKSVDLLNSSFFLGLIMKTNSTFDGLFLDEDSPYALSGNV